MRIRDPIHEAEEPFNLVPLTDMVFNLLIFFMAATTFAQVERQMGLRLPKATAFASLSAAPKQLIINIDSQGKSTIAGKAFELPDLKKLLVDLHSKNNSATVIIRADENGAVRDFAKVLDACKQAGIQEANIGYLSGTSH